MHRSAFSSRSEGSPLDRTGYHGIKKFAMLLHRHERRASTSNHPSVFSMDAKIDLSAHIEDHETAERLGKVLDAAGVTADIASEITLSDLGELLPDAPAAERVGVLKCLRAQQPDPLAMLPNTPSWAVLNRWLTNGTIPSSTD